MKKFSVVVFLFLYANFFVFGQLSIGGTPLSFEKINYTFSEQIPVIQMPEFDLATLIAEDEILDQYKDIPWRFGHNINVNINIKEQGLYEHIVNHGHLWRLEIYSPGALSLNFLFDNYHLPPKAKLFLYNKEKTTVIGAFTALNNQEDRLFATTLIPGERVVIEYFEPERVVFTGELNLSRVTHGYRSPLQFIKGFGSSGSCNVNVACPQAAPMANQIRSVCMLVVNGNGFCTGALINNTNNNGTPYVLSADHCYTNPGSVVFWFNWQSATCSNPSQSPSYQSLSGAINRARYSNTDFWLLQLNQTPPSNYNVYYSGWNRTLDNSITGTVWCIHHPSADIKKISWSNNGVTTTSYGGTSIPGNGTHWRISSWSDGTTTEPGSSGSPLFDPNKRIIGQLHGGSSACGNTLSDWYGKLGVSWTGGGTSSTRLRDWLDPAGTNPMTLDGYDPNSVSIDAQLYDIIVPATSYSSPQNISPQVVIRNNGSNPITSATVSYTLNGGSPVNTTWTGNLTTGQTTTVTFNQIFVPVGNHTFVATVSVTGDGNSSNNSMTRNFTVSDCGTPLTVPYNEIFNSPNLPSCWTIQQTHSTNTWKSTTGYTTGSYTINPQTGSHFWYVQWIAANQNEYLITPRFNFSNVTNLQMTFYFNGSYYWSVSPNNNCDLRLLGRIGTSNWIQLWNETQHPNFNDNTTYTWLQTTVALSSYIGQNNVQFAFQYQGNDGANFAIDNISITGQTTNINDNTTSEFCFDLYPNPTRENVFIDIQNNIFEALSVTITDLEGKVIYFEQFENPQIITLKTADLKPGTYLINIITPSGRFTNKLLKQ